MLWNRWNGIPKRHGVRKAGRLNADGIVRDIIVIGASAGGVSALMQLFSALPGDLPATVGCVLHRGAEPGRLAEVLGRRSGLPVREPDSDEAVQQGVIYLAPADHHLLFEEDRVTVERGPREHSTRPAVDPLFRSAAAAYGERVVGLLLTGGGEDGVSGMIAISRAQGLSLTQDPGEAWMPYMPLNAIRFDEVAGALSIDDLPFVLESLAKGEAVACESAPKRQQA